MKKIILALLVMVMTFVFPSSCFAIDLNQPATTSSIKSEIQRGFITYNLAADKSLATYAHQFDYQIKQVTKQNILSGRDSEAFSLGMYFAAWLRMNYIMENWEPLDLQQIKLIRRYTKSDDEFKQELIKRKADIDKDKILNMEFEKENELRSVEYFSKFRELQLQWEISDKKLCELNDLSYEANKPRFDKWYAKTHP